MSIFQHIREGARALLARPGASVSVCEDALPGIAARLDPQRVLADAAPLDYGVAFARPEEEISFHVLVHLLNFGHGYRHELHRHHGIGAWETMKRGAVRLGAAGAARLRAIEAEEVGVLFFGTPSPPADLRPLRAMITDVLRGSGERLAAATCDDFHALVAPFRSAADVVGGLARTLPAFDDRTRVDGLEVVFLKKAQIAAAELHRRFPRFRYPDVGEFSIACDNVLPCVLRALGAIRLAPDFAALIDRREPLPSGRREAELRAASILAADRIVALAGGAFGAKEFGDYLWKLGKDPAYRPLERHATKDTVFY